MRKILLTLFAMALVVAFTAPSYAADFKYSGFYRVRGSSEAVNGDDGAKDRYLDALIRPRFTAKSGAVTAVYELDFAPGANDGFAVGAGRQTVGTNRWVLDFAVPGSALRVRMGRTDYFSPDKEIYDSGGRHREPGIAVYGKLSGNMSLSAFMTSAREDAGPNNDDHTDYYASVSIKVSPNLTLSPWVANSSGVTKSTTTTTFKTTGVNADGTLTGEEVTTTTPGKDYDYSFLGLHAKGKVGMFNVNASAVFQEGELSSGKDLSGWAVLVRTSASMGKLKLMGNLTMLSGDDGSDASEDGRFRTPQEGGSGWFVGGHIMSSRRWTTFGNDIRSVHLGALNGATVIEGLADFKVSKTFTVGGGVSLYNAAEPSPAENTMDAKEFGTEINVGFKWKIHSSLELRAVGAVIVRGDYGREMGAAEPDDGWAAGWTLRHIF